MLISENTWTDDYNAWAASPMLTEVERAELNAIDEGERREFFWSPMSFGTAGIRGTMGLGTARMNIYTVRRVTQGIADTVHNEGSAGNGVVIARDSRLNGEAYARAAAEVFAANGIRVFCFEQPSPTPELSFAIRRLGAAAGINITASHNPREYNGIKAYWSDGAQLSQEMTSKIAAAVSKYGFFDACTMDFDLARSRGLITILGRDMDDQFINASLEQCKNRADVVAARGFTIVYTPFFGTGARLIPVVLKRLGVENVVCVEPQMAQDGNFPGIAAPNPEKAESFESALELARDCSADLIIGTDPDADRLGAWTKDGSGYRFLTGNQLGALLCDYLLRTMDGRGELPDNACILKSVVSTELSRSVAHGYGAQVVDTFTGFRFIAERIAEFEQNGRYTPVFSFEESYGCMIGSYLRDKDAVGASALTAEMSAYWLGRGMSLKDALETLYERYGYFEEKTRDLYVSGVEGPQKLLKSMEGLRASPPREICGVKVLRVRDYLGGMDSEGNKLGMPGSDNMLYFELEGGTVFVVRPSGTEPKLRLYMMASAPNREDCGDIIRRLERFDPGFQDGT